MKRRLHGLFVFRLATSLSNHVQIPDSVSPVQKCQSLYAGASPFLPKVATLSNCPSTYSARQRRHNSIMRVLIDAAREAGLCESRTDLQLVIRRFFSSKLQAHVPASCFKAL